MEWEGLARAVGKRSIRRPSASSGAVPRARTWAIPRVGHAGVEYDADVAQRQPPGPHVDVSVPRTNCHWKGRPVAGSRNWMQRCADRSAGVAGSPWRAR